MSCDHISQCVRCGDHFESLQMEAERVETLIDLLCEIRSELYNSTEGNFFNDWLKKADAELGPVAIRKYAERKQYENAQT